MFVEDCVKVQCACSVWCFGSLGCWVDWLCRWRQSLCRLTFTAVLWLIFAYLAIVRSNVNQAYKVQEAVVSYVEGIMSHPGISGVRLRTPAESNMPRPRLKASATFGGRSFALGAFFLRLLRNALCV